MQDGPQADPYKWRYKGAPTNFPKHLMGNCFFWITSNNKWSYVTMLITGDFGPILYLHFQPGTPGVQPSCASRKFKEASGGCGSRVDVSCGVWWYTPVVILRWIQHICDVATKLDDYFFRDTMFFFPLAPFREKVWLQTIPFDSSKNPGCDYYC